MDERESQLVAVIDSMAERYGMLPTQVLEQASTFDLQIFYNSALIRDRATKQRKGENVADTYTQEQINEMYRQRTGKEI